jgi:hypothetical protein
MTAAALPPTGVRQLPCHPTRDAKSCSSLARPACLLQDTEIEAAAWLPLEEYQRHQQEFHRGLALYATLMERCLSYARGDHAGLLAAERLDSGLWKPRQDLLMWGGGGAAAAAAREQGGAPVGASSL